MSLSLDSLSPTDQTTLRRGGDRLITDLAHRAESSELRALALAVQRGDESLHVDDDPAIAAHREICELQRAALAVERW